MYRSRSVVAVFRSVGNCRFNFSTSVEAANCDERYGTNLSSVKPFNEIPGPKGLPFLGTLFDYIRPGGIKFQQMFKMMEKRRQEYGPIYKEQIGDKTIVTISDIEEYSKIIKADGKYPSRPVFEPLWKFKSELGVAQGLINSNGNEWYELRQIVGPKLLKPQETLQHVENIDKVTSDFLDLLKINFGSHQSSSFNKTGFVTSDLHNKLFLWSLEAGGTAIFGRRIGCLNPQPPEQAQQYINSLFGTVEELQKLLFGFPFYKYFPTKTWKKFVNHCNRQIENGEGVIKENQRKLESNSATHSNDILSHLLSFSSLNPKDVNLTCMDLMGGAVDTTTMTALWALYYLGRNKDAQESLYKEAVTILPNPDDKITKDDVGKFKYVRACIKETFRIQPVSFFVNRVLNSDVKVCGYSIPAGTLCQANLCSMGSDEKYFPNPNSFIPERWLREEDGKIDPALQIFGSIHFGHGARMCVGRRLAEMELHIFLTKLIRNFHIEWVGESEVQPILQLLLVPDRPIQLRITPR